MNRLSVEKHTFVTTEDYQAALRDKAKIDKIRKTTDFSNPKEIERLYQEIAEDSYHFEGILGREFDDEIYDCNEELKKRSKNATYSGKGKAADKDNTIKKGISLEDYDEPMQKQILEEMKKKEKRRKLLLRVSLCVACFSFGYLLLYYFMQGRTDIQTKQLASMKETKIGNLNLQINKTAQDETDREILEEYKELYHLNKKLIGWIKIDDTLVDYPVMQTSNNEYYLDHNFKQDYDKNGSVFMDAQCDAKNRSTNLILYGHNMKSGKMFGDLKNYTKESFYKKHPYVQFDTLYEKGIYQIMYVFRSKVYTEDIITFKYYQFIEAASEEEFYSNMKEMSKLSFYNTEVTADYGDELITLSTCDYNEPNGRLVIVAKRVEQ